MTNSAAIQMDIARNFILTENRNWPLNFSSRRAINFYFLKIFNANNIFIKMTTKSEDVVGETWDYCIADSLIKTGKILVLISYPPLKNIVEIFLPLLKLLSV